MATEEEQTGRPDIEECIENCTECYRLCLETIEYCLRLGGQNATTAHIRILTDCARLCQLTADFIIRGSDMHRTLCALCAEACERCSDRCEFVGENDLQMQECAELCAECAASCREQIK